MRRFGIMGVYLFALAAWAQLLAPAAAARMMPAFDPFAVICATPSADDGGGTQGTHHGAQAHQCCVLCHAMLGPPPADARPAYTTLDYPVASRLRWRHVAVAPRPHKPAFRHRPRDPPALV